VKEQALKTKWSDSARFKKCALGDGETAMYGNYIRAGHLTYARVKGAGHMISENRPAESKFLFENWIFNRGSFQECNPGP
jgi:cathepsin A (carboxypeptidase C)